MQLMKKEKKKKTASSPSPLLFLLYHHLTKLFYLTFTFVLFSPTVHTKRA